MDRATRLPWGAIPASSPEISDLIAAFDPTGHRAPIDRAAVLAALAAHGNALGARIVASMPYARGEIEARAADALLLEAHLELQRLSEEFDHGRRAADLLRPLVRTAREGRGGGRTRVADLGCGLGYVVRYLAFHGALGGEVSLVGADFNPRLIEEARALARAEGLAVEFVLGDVATDAAPADVVLSTGLLHHLPPPALRAFFARQRARAQAFAHFDFQPSPLAPFGAWLFHRARFRSPLARHDGVLSALRAHDRATLLDAAADPTGEWSVAVFGARFGPFPRVFHAVVGVHTAQRDAFRASLGARRQRLGAWR